MTEFISTMATIIFFAWALDRFEKNMKEDLKEEILNEIENGQ